MPLISLPELTTRYRSAWATGSGYIQTIPKVAVRAPEKSLGVPKAQFLNATGRSFSRTN